MIRVAKNLHKKQYSLRQGSKVVGYATHLTLQNCTFEVNEKTRQRVIRNRQKEVHAFVVGEPVDGVSLPEDAIHISYNPYRSGRFYRKDNGQEIGRADWVFFTPDGVFALGLQGILYCKWV